MAMMDNVDFLINHIRNAFVTSDDTSMSEWVITECRMQDHLGNHRYNRNNYLSRSDSNSDCQSDSELKGSVDIHPDMDFGAHRRRSNTAQRLERLKKEKRTQSKTKTIKWKQSTDIYKAEEKGHLFEKKVLPSRDGSLVSLASFTSSEGFDEPNVKSNDFESHEVDSETNEIEGQTHSKTSEVEGQQNITTSDGKDQLDDMKIEIVDEPENKIREVVSKPVKQRSALSHQLSGSLDNPFFKYAKFDGRTAGGKPTRKLDIFVTFAGSEQREYPMTILVTANAKVQEVVGLVCWQYTQDGRKPDLNSVVGKLDPDDLSKFSLHMAEDDGEIDEDWPAIIPTDPVYKYEFTKFALVANAAVQPKFTNVIIHVPNRGYNTFPVDSKTVTMRELMEKVIKRRKIKTTPGLPHTLEKKSEIGKPIDLDAELGSLNCFEFYLIRENSSRGDAESIEEEDKKIAESLLSHQYKSFIVSMVHKWRTNIEVQLGISGDKIEIDPVSIKGTARLIRGAFRRPITYDADCVAACDITESKTNGRAAFRMTYLTGHDYKHHNFEADLSVAYEIVEKVNNILELKFSPVRKEFVYCQEKKALRKRDSIKLS